MKKGLKIALTVLNFVAVIGVFLFAIAFIFIGLFGEALVAVFTLGHADAEGAIVGMFAPSALMLFGVSILDLIATILFIVSFKKVSKGLQIAIGSLFSFVALLLLVAIVVLFVRIGFSQDSIKAYVVISLLALLHVALYVLSGVFGGFLPAFKKQPEQLPE